MRLRRNWSDGRLWDWIRRLKAWAWKKRLLGVGRSIVKRNPGVWEVVELFENLLAVDYKNLEIVSISHEGYLRCIYRVTWQFECSRTRLLEYQMVR